MDLNAHVKFMIGNAVCPIHHQKAAVEVKDGNFNFNCCCTPFKIECLKTTIKLLTVTKASPSRAMQRKNAIVGDKDIPQITHIRLTA